jgi:hypothetical protein
MDKQQLELRRLRYEMKAWMTKAIIQMAQSGQEFNTKEIDHLMSNLSNDTLDMNSEIFQRPDVLNYISTVNEVRTMNPSSPYDPWSSPLACRKLMLWSWVEVSHRLGSTACPSSLLEPEGALASPRSPLG